MSQTVAERIMAAPEATVKAILVALCEESRVEKRVKRHLDNILKASIGDNRRKRKAPDDDIRICIRCNTAFKESENVNLGCRFHDGK